MEFAGLFDVNAVGTNAPMYSFVFLYCRLAQFLPADKQSYLRIQLLLNALSVRYSSIRSSMFIYNHHIVSSSLPMDQSRVLFSFLVDHVLRTPRSPGVETWSAGNFAVFDASATASTSNGVTAEVAPPGVAGTSASGSKLPLHRVFMTAVAEDGAHESTEDHRENLSEESVDGKARGGSQYLLVYCQGPAVLCVLFELDTSEAEQDLATTADSELPTSTQTNVDQGAIADFARFLRPMLAEELKTLQRSIGGAAGTGTARSTGASVGRGGDDERFRFVYFNQMNLAVKVSAGLASSAILGPSTGASTPAGQSQPSTTGTQAPQLSGTLPIGTDSGVGASAPLSLSPEFLAMLCSIHRELRECVQRSLNLIQEDENA
eukprot:SAG31_NODE_856_length_11439_cov_3.721233_8_plen_376_part_00